jgi:hypothetical protein
MGAFDDVDGLEWASYTASSLREPFSGNSFGPVLERDIWASSLMQNNVLPQIDVCQYYTSKAQLCISLDLANKTTQ